MPTPPHTWETVAKAPSRTMLDALGEALSAARPHVEEAHGWYSALLLDAQAQDAAELLARIDVLLAAWQADVTESRARAERAG